MSPMNEVPAQTCKKCWFTAKPFSICPNCKHEHVGTSPIMKEVHVTCFSDIEMKEVQWLWPDRIAIGKLTVISGKPGLGKSTLTAYLASIVTTGSDWPDCQNSHPISDVLFLSAEDDPADTIKPRLVAAGADISKCHVLEAIKDESKSNKTRSFDLSKDIERLETRLKFLKGIRLIIIDPISAYLGGTDSHNNADIRALLQPFQDMAAATNISIIALTHESKSEKQDPINRVIGSIGMVAAARAAYTVMKDEQDPEKRYFLPLKNNIGNDKDGFSYKIEGVILDNRIKSSKIRWDDGVVLAQKIFNPEKATATNGAGDFLFSYLQNGPKSSNDVFEQGESAGYSKSSLQRAKQRLKIKAHKQGMSGGWVWSLSDSDSENPEDAEDVEDTLFEIVNSSLPS